MIDGKQRNAKHWTKCEMLVYVAYAKESLIVYDDHVSFVVIIGIKLAE